MEAKNPKKRSCRELTPEKQERLQKALKLLIEEYKRRKSIMLKRHALFTSLIGEAKTLEEFYEKNSELAMLWGVDMYFLKSHLGKEECINLHINLGDYDYEDYYVVKDNDGLKVSSTVSWKDLSYANTDTNIFSEEEDEGDDESSNDYWKTNEAENQ